MKRRRFLHLAAGSIVAGIVIPLDRTAILAEPASDPQPLLSIAHGPSPESITRAAIDGLGGISRIVHRGDKVVIKPNIGWDRTPEQAACTNPEVVGALVGLCLGAGAGSVLVLDNTCNDPRRCYLRSGISEAVKKAGGKIDFFDEDRTKKLAIKGERLSEWPVHPAFVERDVLINVPVAKHHGLADLTLGMKNWLGAIGGSRNRLHQDLDLTIVDLAAFFRPDLTVIDGVRILTRGGPQGGSLSDVRRLDTVIASVDPVAAEARGAMLHERDPLKMPHIGFAEARGLGRSRWEPAEEKRIEVSGR
jgi:uncharacterized protein (DUF362 family)